MVNETVDIHASPVASFTAGAVCEGETTSFTDLSLPNGSDTLETGIGRLETLGPRTTVTPSTFYDMEGFRTVTLGRQRPALQCCQVSDRCRAIRA